MNTEIKNAVNIAGDKAQYDARVKRILGEKHILAHILEKTVNSYDIRAYKIRVRKYVVSRLLRYVWFYLLVFLY